MSNRIEEIRIENFKSYGGRHVIGPFKTFTAVIGPNGAGKSNVMDAISFVLGVRTNQLRGKNLQNLIHKKEEEKESTRTAIVELVFYNADEEVLLRRTINPGIGSNKASSHYSINGKTVKWDEYNSKLKEFGVLVRARNFLVFQGDVESIAQKTPKELTELFEQISGSVELRQEYEALQEKYQQAEEVFLRTFEKKRNITKEKKQLKEQKDEAEHFTMLQEEKQNVKQQFFLFQLFHAQTDLKANLLQLEELETELEEQKKAFNEVDQDVKAKSKTYAKARRGIVLLEKEIQKETTSIEKKRPTLIKMKEEIIFITKTLDKLKEKEKKWEQSIKSIKQRLKLWKRRLRNYKGRLWS